MRERTKKMKKKNQKEKNMRKLKMKGERSKDGFKVRLSVQVQELTLKELI